MTVSVRCLIIDDDPLNNLISQTVIARAEAKAQVTAFTEPEAGLAYISQRGQCKTGPVFVFLDINMPTMSGWEFLEHFEQLDNSIKNLYKIFILSSSVDDRDKERAEQNSRVLDYVEKPLKIERVKMLFEKFLHSVQ